MSDIITDRKSAIALVKYERDRSKIVYADYISANAVTLDTVGQHVAALQALAFPTFDAKTTDDEEKYRRKAFGNRVRNGLNHTLGKRTPSQREESADASTGDAETGEGAEVATVTMTPVGTFIAAVETFLAAGYSLSDAQGVLDTLAAEFESAAA